MPESQEATWRSVKELFDRVVECPPEERSRVLHEARAREAVVVREVEALLATEELANRHGFDLPLPTTADDPAARSIAAGVSRLLAPGARVQRCEVERVLGFGRDGPLYLAWESAKGTAVSLRQLAKNTSVRQGHPPLEGVCLHDRLEDSQGERFAVRHYVSGSPLAEWLLGGHVSSEEAKNVACRLVEIVARVHDVGLVLGGLRPSSVIIGRGGDVTLIDVDLIRTIPGPDPMGASSRAERESEPTPPECIAGAVPDARSDVFCLAALVRDIVNATVSRPSPPSKESDSNRDVAHVLDRASSPNPYVRPANGRLLLDELSKVWQQDASWWTPKPDSGRLSARVGRAIVRGLAQAAPEATRPLAAPLQLGFWVLTAITLAKLVIGLPAVVERGLEGLPTTHISRTPFQAVLATEFSIVGASLVFFHRREAATLFFGVVLLLMATPFVDGPLADMRLGSNRLWATLASLWSVRNEAFLPAVTWLFTQAFLNQRDRWMSGLVVCAWVVGLLLVAVNLPLSARTPQEVWAPRFSRLDSHSLYWPILYASALPALGLLLGMRGTTASEGARRLFAIGLLIGVAPVCLLVTYDAVFGLHGAGQTTTATWENIVVYSSLMAIPVWTAYAVLRGRVLPWRESTGLGTPHVVVRTICSAATVLPFVIIVGRLYAGRAQPVQELLIASSGIPIAAWTLLGIVLLWYRTSLLERIDHWWTRDSPGPAAPHSASRHDVSGYLGSLDAQVEREAAPLRGTCYVLDRDRRRFGSTTTPGWSWIPATLDLGARHAPERFLVCDATSLLQGHRSPPRGADARTAFVFPGWDGDEPVALVVAEATDARQWPDARRARALTRLSQHLVAARQSSVERGLCPFDELSGLECVRCGRIYARTTIDCCQGSLLPAPLPRVIGGRYELQRRIGTGASGAVYVARELSLNRLVAIKTFRRASQSSAEHLRREARTLASVNHPRMAAAYALETWQGRPLIISEFFPEGTLEDRLRRGPLTTNELERLVHHVTSALEYLHERGLVHGDIKAPNIGITEAGDFKLLDFGLAGPVDLPQGDRATGEIVMEAPFQADLESASIVFNRARGLA